MAYVRPLDRDICHLCRTRSCLWHWIVSVSSFDDQLNHRPLKEAEFDHSSVPKKNEQIQIIIISHISNRYHRENTLIARSDSFVSFTFDTSPLKKAIYHSWREGDWILSDVLKWPSHCLLGIESPIHFLLTWCFRKIVFWRDKRFATLFQILRGYQSFERRIFHLSCLSRRERALNEVIWSAINVTLPATSERRLGKESGEYHLPRTISPLLWQELIYPWQDRKRNEFECTTKKMKNSDNNGKPSNVTPTCDGDGESK